MKEEEIREMGLDDALIKQITSKDESKLIFESNQKLLDELLRLERNLVNFEKQSKLVRLKDNRHTFKRKCACGQTHEKQKKDISHYFKF